MFFILSASCFCLSCVSRQEPGIGKGIQNGKYRLNFDIQDAICEQIIEINNSTQNSDLYNDLYNYTYTITIKEYGSLHHRNMPAVITSGVVSGGMFKFLVPKCSLPEVEAYYFQGNNEFKNGMLKGTGKHFVSGTDWGKFNFTMKRLNP
jgi:hypothetical protein